LKNKPIKTPASFQIATIFMLDTFLAYSPTLKMKAIYSYETSVEFQPTTQIYIPKDTNFQRIILLGKYGLVLAAGCGCVFSLGIKLVTAFVKLCKAAQQRCACIGNKNFCPILPCLENSKFLG
jgi:hypothetical protein